MRLGEHVFNLHTTVDIPLGHIVLFHGVYVLLGQQLGRLALSRDLHNLERHAGIEALVHQIGHNAVARADDLRNRTGAAFDKVLRVTEPDVGAVRKARYLQ